MPLNALAVLLMFLCLPVVSELRAYELPKGHQAVGIRVTQEMSAADFASLPNSRVNLISVLRLGGDKYMKTVLVENVLILAADTHVNQDADGRTKVSRVVIVALQPQDVLKLELIKTNGFELVPHKPKN
jgi:Flp pilus assembly protein CpaB